MKPLSKHETRRKLLRGVPDPELLATLTSRWYETPLGQKVLQAERAIATPILSRLFGYHILQVGCSEEYSLIDDSPVGHKIIFAPAWRPGVRRPVASNEELPLATDGIDVIVAHHALDFTGDSHRLLRELTRVLRPGGHMLIIGFNPWSHWGVWKLLKRRNKVPWRGRFISRRRMNDWLRLLDLHVDSVHFGLHFPPLKFSRPLQQAQRLERFGRRLNSPLGGAYFILCIKQVAPLTPVLPGWRSLRSRATAIPAVENVGVRLH